MRKKKAKDIKSKLTKNTKGTNKKVIIGPHKLPDIQKTKIKSLKLNRVGVSGVDFPIYIKTKKGKDKVLCYAKVNMFVSLKHNVKGINMSRLPRTLMKFRKTNFSRWVMWKFLYNLKKHSDTSDAYAEINFKYFIDKEAPVTKEKSTMAYDCSFIGHIDDGGYTFHMRTTVVGTSNCPCSKEISKHGAHGQRSVVTVTVETRHKRVMYLEDLINLIENQMSCEVYPVLKRPDEKYVTEKAYNNPKFVEDIARDIALSLQKSSLLKWYKIKVENEESIHMHNAVSYISRKLKGKRWVDAGKTLRKVA